MECPKCGSGNITRCTASVGYDVYKGGEYAWSKEIVDVRHIRCRDCGYIQYDDDSEFVE